MRLSYVMAGLATALIGAGCGGCSTGDSDTPGSRPDGTRSPKARAAYIQGYILSNVKPPGKEVGNVITDARCRPYPKALFVCDVRVTRTEEVPQGTASSAFPFKYLAYMPEGADEPSVRLGPTDAARSCEVDVDFCLRIARASKPYGTTSRKSTPSPTASEPKSVPSPRSAEPSVPAKFIRSPSGNIECQLDEREALCIVESAGRQASVTSAGEVEIGEQSSNAPTEGITTLGYGESARRGRLQCTSTKTGIRCSNTRGAGFLAAREGIRRL